MKNRLRTIASEHRGSFAAGLLSQAVQSYIGLSTIVLFQRIIDVLRTGEPARLGRILGIYIVLTALNHLLIYIQGYPQKLSSVGCNLSIKRLGMRKISTIDYRTYTEMETGTTIQIVEAGANAGTSIINDFWYFIIITGLTLPVQLYLIQRYDFTLFFIVIAGYAVLFAISRVLMRVSRNAMQKVVSRKEELAGKIARSFMELVDFRIRQRFSREMEEAGELAHGVIRSEARIGLINELFFTGFALMVFVVEIMVITRQATLIASGASTAGTLVALVLFVRNVFSPVSHFSYAYVRYRMNRVPWKRFEEFLDLPDDQNLIAPGERPRVRMGDISLEHVSCRYGNREAIRDLSASFETGTRTAIVGTSGAGKTTVLRLLLGLLSPNDGRVVIGGTDLNEVDIQSYYRNIEYVSQDNPVAAGTLRSNLSGGRTAEGDRVEEALESFDLGHLIEKLDLEIGEKGITLSTGERQRIALARAALSEAPLVLLDEPTAALDGPTAMRVMSAFYRATQGRTVIMVAHRLQPVRECDRIIVMESGTIVEDGTFNTLVGSGGPFAGLWSEQTRK